MHLRLLGEADAISAAYDVERLYEGLSTRDRPLSELTVAASLASTNSEALERAAIRHDEGFVGVLADAQTAGRGRRGRSWQSPPGKNLYLSLAWRSQAPFTQALSALPLAIGVVIADTLSGLGLPVSLKWPNDLYVDGGKLGGILLESRVLGERMALVAGIGLNHHPDESLRTRVDQPIRFLAEHLGELDRESLVVTLLAQLTDAVGRYREQGMAPFLDAWRRRDLLRDRHVRVEAAGGAFDGIARGIDADGELLVETAEGLKHCRSGEVSVRAA